MRKLAFECAGSFEMPTLKMVGLEKGHQHPFRKQCFCASDQLQWFDPESEIAIGFAGRVG